MHSIIKHNYINKACEAWEQVVYTPWLNQDMGYEDISTVDMLGGDAQVNPNGLHTTNVALPDLGWQGVNP